MVRWCRSRRALKGATTWPVALRVTGLRQMGSRLTVEGYFPELEFELLPFTAQVTLHKAGEGRCEIHGVRFQVDRGLPVEAVRGQALDIEISLEDPNGDVGRPRSESSSLPDTSVVGAALEGGRLQFRSPCPPARGPARRDPQRPSRLSVLVLAQPSTPRPATPRVETSAAPPRPPPGTRRQGAPARPSSRAAGTATAALLARSRPARKAAPRRLVHRALHPAPTALARPPPLARRRCQRRRRPRRRRRRRARRRPAGEPAPDVAVLVARHQRDPRPVGPGRPLRPRCSPRNPEDHECTAAGAAARTSRRRRASGHVDVSRPGTRSRT